MEVKYLADNLTSSFDKKSQIDSEGGGLAQIYSQNWTQQGQLPLNIQNIRQNLSVLNL